MRVRSCGLAKNRGHVWRHVGIGDIEDRELYALFMCGPLLSHPRRAQRIPQGSGRIVEGPGGHVNGKFGGMLRNSCRMLSAQVRLQSKFQGARIAGTKRENGNASKAAIAALDWVADELCGRPSGRRP